MQALNTIKDLIANSLLANRQNWWVEVTTVEPNCTYYFGPFQNYQEAKVMCPGYIEDLQVEGAKKIKAFIKCCKPEILTVFDE
jgi:Domain of unknown function (DUF1816)